MPITRTPMIDDDGSGTTGTILNNAWKQEFYNQIDGVVGAVVGPSTPWTVVDASGAGLVLTSVGRYVVVGKVVLISATVNYPATASGALARPGGLPLPSMGGGLVGGFYSIRGPYNFNLQPSSTALYVQNQTSSANFTNADLSGASLVFAGLYFID